MIRNDTMKALVVKRLRKCLQQERRNQDVNPCFQSQTDSERERGADALTKEKSRHKEAADEGKSSHSKESFVLWTFFHS